MEEAVAALVRDSVGWGITVLIMIGLYRLANRFIDVHEKFLEELCEDIRRIADDFHTAYGKDKDK